MAGFNKVILLANLTRDPQLKNLPGGSTVTEFGLASNRKWKTEQGEDREEVTFVDCSAFGKTGETINQYFSKGKPILVEGRLKWDSWDAPDGGGRRSKLSVVVERFTFVGGKDDGQGNAPAQEAPAQRQQPPPAQQRSAGQRTTRPAPAKQEPPFGEEPVFEEADIPF